MRDKLDQIRAQAVEAIAQAADLEALEQARVETHAGILVLRKRGQRPGRGPRGP